MKQIIILHLNEDSNVEEVTFLGQTVRIRRIGCQGDVARVEAAIEEYDSQVDAIGLEGMPAQLQLGPARRAHETGATIPTVARTTPVVDGSGIRAGLER
ncbi:MAG: hypothetical protein KC418_23745, partial [Anaerolineales bacterium]|nr:hypothetical protein [Anaerolineales bacterium]